MITIRNLEKLVVTNTVEKEVFIYIISYIGFFDEKFDSKEQLKIMINNIDKINIWIMAGYLSNKKYYSRDLVNWFKQNKSELISEYNVKDFWISEIEKMLVKICNLNF